MDTDVLIVGAGPTGLMLANQLVRRGVRVLIIDRHAGPSLQTRALGVQARTLEIYAQLGIVEQALALGKRGTGANIWAQGRRMARVPLGEAGQAVTPYPYILILGQDDNERIMGDKLRELGLSVQWNTELVGLEQQPDSVTATLRHPDGTSRKLVAAWVAGCDGARSAVRELSGIAFPGAPYEHVFFVADVEATGSMTASRHSIESAAFWFIALERCCRQQLMIDATGRPPVLVPPERARYSREHVGSDYIGWLHFQPIYDRLMQTDPDMFD